MSSDSSNSSSSSLSLACHATPNKWKCLHKFNRDRVSARSVMFFFFLFFLCSHPLCFFSSFLVYIPKWFLQTGFDCTYTYYPRKRQREETGAWRLAETVWVAHFVVVAALPSHCWKYTEYMYMKYNEQSSEAREDSQTALKRFNFYHDAFHLPCVIFFTNCLVDFFSSFSCFPCTGLCRELRLAGPSTTYQI